MQMAGAKRQRVTMDKGARLTQLRDEVEGFVGRLRAEHHPAIVACLNTVNNMEPLKTYIDGMDGDLAQATAKSISTTSNVDHRVQILVKAICAANHLQLQGLESKIKAAKETMRAAVEFSLYTAYAADNGLVSWDKVQDDLMSRMRVA